MMRDALRRGEAQVLISTSIVEAGLDIPTANTLVVFDAHRFGLASLYQLRGRVGRGAAQAHALLTYPEGTEVSPEGRRRLAALTEFSALGSGLGLAQRDLEIRGAGSLLGADQSGDAAGGVGFELYAQMLQEEVLAARAAAALGDAEEGEEGSEGEGEGGESAGAAA